MTIDGKDTPNTCQCEHGSHFESGAVHDYGHECTEEMRDVRTEYGTFRACLTCYTHHLKQWEISPGARRDCIECGHRDNSTGTYCPECGTAK